MQRFFLQWVPLYLCVAVSVGCTTVPNMSNPLTRNKPKVPEKMVYVWTPYEQTNPTLGGPPLRGIGGHFLFYDSIQTKNPIKVDGTLTVFVFDGEKEPDDVPAGKSDKPLKKYLFSAEQVEKCYAKNDLGHGYDFFVPIDELGNPEQRYCVISRFDDTKTGKIVTAQIGYTTLPGPPRVKEDTQIAKTGNTDKNTTGMGIKTATTSSQSSSSPYQQAGGVSRRDDSRVITSGYSERSSSATAMTAAVSAIPSVMNDENYREPSYYEEVRRRQVTAIHAPQHMSRHWQQSAQSTERGPLPQVSSSPYSMNSMFPTPTPQQPPQTHYPSSQVLPYLPNVPYSYQLPQYSAPKTAGNTVSSQTSSDGDNVLDFVGNSGEKKHSLDIPLTPDPFVRPTKPQTLRERALEAVKRGNGDGTNVVFAPIGP